jgi:hypothetical protein
MKKTARSQRMDSNSSVNSQRLDEYIASDIEKADLFREWLWGCPVGLVHIPDGESKFLFNEELLITVNELLLGDMDAWVKRRLWDDLEECVAEIIDLEKRKKYEKSETMLVESMPVEVREWLLNCRTPFLWWGIPEKDEKGDWDSLLALHRRSLYQKINDAYDQWIAEIYPELLEDDWDLED